MQKYCCTSDGLIYNYIQEYDALFMICIMHITKVRPGSVYALLLTFIHIFIRILARELQAHNSAK